MIVVLPMTFNDHTSGYDRSTTGPVLIRQHAFVMLDSGKMGAKYQVRAAIYRVFQSNIDCSHTHIHVAAKTSAVAALSSLNQASYILVPSDNPEPPRWQPIG